MQQLQRICEANDTTTTTTASSCSFDISNHSDSSSASFAPPCIARLARAMHILPRPTFHPNPVPKRSLSTCPILITGLPPRSLRGTFCGFVLDLTRPSTAGTHFISNPSYAITCHSQRCKLQCGIHNDSSVLLIPEMACESSEAFPVSITFGTQSETAAQTLFDLLIISRDTAAAPDCAGGPSFRATYSNSAA